MTLEEAMSYWNTDAEAHSRAQDRSQILETVKREASAFEAQIRRRDRREVIAAALVFAFFTFVALSPSSWLTRIGALLVIAGCITTIWQLRRARIGRPAAAADGPLADVLRAEHARVDAQIHLLESVLWWYIAPFAVGVILVFAGAAGASWTTLLYTTVVAGGAIAIFHVNRRAARQELAPRRERLAGLLRAIEA